MFTNHMYLIYLRERDLELNKLQWLYGIKLNKTKLYILNIYV